MMAPRSQKGKPTERKRIKGAWNRGTGEGVVAPPVPVGRGRLWADPGGFAQPNGMVQQDPAGAGESGGGRRAIKWLWVGVSM